jgi:hypothetical protein
VSDEDVGEMGGLFLDAKTSAGSLGGADGMMR